MSLSSEDRTLLIGALDSLGVALADHGHTWTVGEKEIYERAMLILGVPQPDNRPTDLDALEERE